MKLYIKHMVSLRCQMMVKAELSKIGLRCGKVELGVVEILDKISPEKQEELKMGLQKFGLELLNSNKAILIEKIKSAVIEMVHIQNGLPQRKNSDYLCDKLHHNYTYLANVFSETTGTTIEHFIIAHKIERVKELLIYDDMNIAEISYKLNYSSVAHLSNQFKKVIGITPSYFKKIKRQRLNMTENI